MKEALLLFQLGVVLYTFLGMLDLIVAQSLKKRHRFYPILHFTCFCGWSLDVMGVAMIPDKCYRFLKMRKHTKNCLTWILNADFNGLTPYWAHSYAKDLRELTDGTKTVGLLGKDFHLKMAKRYSQRVKEGKDPFGDFDPKELI